MTNKPNEIEEFKHIKGSKYKTISKIQDLEILAKNAAMVGDYEKAFNYAEEIIKLAIRGGVDSYIKEQQQFLNAIAEKVHKDYVISEIEKHAMSIKKIYEKLINTDQIKQAHEILEAFRKNYSDNSYFNSIPLIQELINKDVKLWAHYNILNSECNESRFPKKNNLKNLRPELDEIKKFLKLF
ncbi:MAG: hypothetical protein ACFFFB_21255 [Candidatus Heimdallarchaeota archaeon]